MAKAKPESGAASEDELGLWQRAMRGTKPLRGRKPAGPPAPSLEPETKAPREAARPPAPRPPAPAKASPLPELSAETRSGLDARTAERLRRGRLPIEGRLDLHGHTQDEAHRALIAFVEAAWRRGARCLLVITGKGRAEGGGGVLRASVPRWLNAEPLRPRVLAIARAQQRDGGAGALYVLLKRQRAP